MATAQLSPGVVTLERDLTGIVPNVATTIGATVGVYNWGPVGQPYRVSTESELVSVFGKPDDRNFGWFFTAANFLSYASNLLINRVELFGARNSCTASFTALTGTIGVTDGSNVVAGVGTAFEDELTVGDKIKFTSGGNEYTAYVTEINSDTSAKLDRVILVTATGLSATKLDRVVVNNQEDYDMLEGPALGLAGNWIAKYPGEIGDSITVSVADNTSFDAWAYKGLFPSKPDTTDYAAGISANALDEMHIVVIDRLGYISGEAGSVLERFSYVSKASDAVAFGGVSNYYVNVVNRSSQFIWFADHISTGLSVTGQDWGDVVRPSQVFKTLTTASTLNLTNGDNGGDATEGEIFNAFLVYKQDELYDVSLIPVGPSSAVVAKGVIENVAEVRQDCVVFDSPKDQANGPIIGNTDLHIQAILTYRNTTLNANSSYAFLDSGWKRQYDKYNDVYRWVPLNGDIAGLTARSDLVADAWKSPAGFNRGIIKNVVKLGVNPNKTQRDTLYSAGVNPVVSFAGQGTILYGDKTLLTKPSAFDRINVRRLFIVLRKAIARAAQYQLFENNVPFTRAQFRSYVEPYLREIQGRDGITGFRVICDETNNTADVIMRNEFRGDILIQPAYSINFIQLTFSAVRSDVSFSEIAGA